MIRTVSVHWTGIWGIMERMRRLMKAVGMDLVLQKNWRRSAGSIQFVWIFLTEALGLYDTDYIYFYKENGILYGVNAQEESIPVENP